MAVYLKAYSIIHGRIVHEYMALMLRISDNFIMKDSDLCYKH